MRNILIYFAVKYRGDYFKIFSAIKSKEVVDEKELEKTINLNIKAITVLDNEYPPSLRECYYPPFVLFYKGDISLIYNGNNLGVIGSRHASKYGIAATKKILNELLLSNDICIVSGLAKGIDSIGHRCALESSKKTIAVLGCGIDVCYPENNYDLYKCIEEEGLLISEYPFDTRANKEHFPMRNRIIAALSKGILVTDAKSKSGTQITIRYALELGKDIMVIPHSIFEDSFCNTLLKQGAYPVIDGNDIKEILGI